jgi:hypothetical protein
MEYVGEFEWTNPKADAGLFVEGLRQSMVEKLQEMRGGPVA